MQRAVLDVGLPADEMSPAELVAYQNRLQGRLGEVLYMQTLSEQGHEALDLNAFAMNFPGYDVKAGDEWSSVKTLHVAEDEPNLSSYRHHLDILTEHSKPAQDGKYEGQGLPLYAAHALADLSSDNAKSLLEEQSPEEMQQILRENGCLALPDDHLEKLHNYLQGEFYEYVLNHPQRYGIDLGASQEEQEYSTRAIASDYCRRLRPLGFTSQEIYLALNRVIPIQGRGK